MSHFNSPKFLRDAVNQESAQSQIDLTKPSIARVYSYYLGGKDHFQVDREMCDYATSVVPETPKLAVANRKFVQRAVLFMVESGITQFIDIGSGLPTDGNIHQIAHEIRPEARVVYVDNDLTVQAHARAILEDADTCAFIGEDLLEPEKILGHPKTAHLIDFTKPVGLILGGILHHLSSHHESLRVSAVLRDALPAGSYLAISHFSLPDPDHPEDAERAQQVEKAFQDKLGHGRWSPREEILAYFGDFEPVPPGLVNCDAWRRTRKDPNIPKEVQPLIAGGVAQKKA